MDHSEGARQPIESLPLHDTALNARCRATTHRPRVTTRVGAIRPSVWAAPRPRQAPTAGLVLLHRRRVVQQRLDDAPGLLHGVLPGEVRPIPVQRRGQKLLVRESVQPHPPARNPCPSGSPALPDPRPCGRAESLRPPHRDRCAVPTGWAPSGSCAVRSAELVRAGRPGVPPSPSPVGTCRCAGRRERPTISSCRSPASRRRKSRWSSPAQRRPHRDTRGTGRARTAPGRHRAWPGRHRPSGR